MIFERLKKMDQIVNLGAHKKVQKCQKESMGDVVTGAVILQMTSLILLQTMRYTKTNQSCATQRTNRIAQYMQRFSKR